MNRGRSPRSYEETLKAFTDMIDKKCHESCWEWQGAITSGGYGEFRIDGHTYPAHRISYVLFFGDIPEGMLVCHKCDNPRCVNPYHLFIGTQKDNLQDASRKGRLIGVGRNGRFTNEQIVSIREEYKVGNTTHRALAKKYKTSHQNINFILQHQRYAHVGGV